MAHSPIPPRDLIEAATNALQHAYAPYSGARVGAALRYASGQIVSGCNVENASFGATICAERNAVFAGVLAGEREISEILVLTDTPMAWPPCGMCRQVLSEFSATDAIVHWGNLGGHWESARFFDLMPHAFRREHLTKVQG
jgi:cytidine deaminase